MSQAVLNISIDTRSSAETSLASARSIEATGQWLLESLASRALPATWTIDEVGSSLVRRLSQEPSRHEIALGSPAAGSASVASDLSQRTSEARARGLQVSTWSLTSAAVDATAERALRAGISAFCVLADAPVCHTQSPAISRVRHGLWRFDVSLSLPGQSRWLPGGGGMGAARSVIDQIAARNATCVMCIDVPRVAASGVKAQRVIERVLTHVRLRESERRLRLTSLAGAVALLASRHQGQPTRSILRGAA